MEYATSNSSVGSWKNMKGVLILRRDQQAAGELVGVGHNAPFRCADGISGELISPMVKKHVVEQ